MPGREPHPDDAPYRPWGPGHPDYPKPKPNKLARTRKTNDVNEA